MSPLILYLVTTRSSAIVCSCSSSDILAVEFQSPVGRSKRQTPALPLSFGSPCLREHQPGLRTKPRPLYRDVKNVTATTTRQKCSRTHREKELFTHFMLWELTGSALTLSLHLPKRNTMNSEPVTMATSSGNLFFFSKLENFLSPPPYRAKKCHRKSLSFCHALSAYRTKAYYIRLMT